MATLGTWSASNSTYEVAGRGATHQAGHTGSVCACEEKIASRAVQAAPEIPSARLADLLRTEGVMKKESLNNVNQ